MSVNLSANLRESENLLSRLDRMPINRTIVMLILLLAVVWILEAFDIGIIAPVLLLLHSQWNLTPSQLGLIGSTGTLGIVIGLLPAGALADRYGRKNLLLIGIVVFSVFTLVSSFATNVPELVIFRFIAGLGQGAVFPVPYLMLSEFVNKKWRGTAVGLSNSLLGFAYALNTLAGVWVLHSFAPSESWRVLLIIGVVPIIMVPVIWKWLPESPRILLKLGRLDVVRKFVERLEDESHLPHDTNLIDDRSLHVLEVTAEKRVSVMDLLKPPYLKRCFVSFTTLLSPFVLFYVITIYGPVILEKMGATKVDALLYTAGLLGVTVISNMASGLVGDKIGRRNTLLIAMTVAAISTVALSQDLPRAAIVIAAILTWGFVYAGFPPAKLYMAEQFPTRLRATGSMLGESVTRFLAGVVLTYFIPVLLSMLGLPTLFVILAVVTELCLLPILFFGVQTSGIAIEQTGTDLTRYDAAGAGGSVEPASS
ncbi:MAG: MFS transporter [Vulcanimicrobiaceae bacterium]